MKSLLFLRIGFVFALVLQVASPFAARAADAAKLADVPARMRQFVSNATVSGAVTLVAKGGKVLQLEAVGFSDLAAKKPMKADDLFWIASMTKPITGAAVLMLQDEGKLSVDDPVEKYLPEFKGQWLVSERTKETLTLKRPSRPITLRDLLTHTSGLGSLDSPRPNATLAELVMGYSQLTLQSEPGTKWSYNNPGINTLGRVVELVSGKPFAVFLEERLLKPLAMKDTTFWPTPAQAQRIAKSYQPGPDNKGLAETDVYFLRGLPVTDRTRTPAPAGGLFSTAADIAKFYQMMLNGGEANGRRYLSAEAVKQLTTTQTGDIKTGFTTGMSWGFGFQVVKESQGVTAVLAPGTFGHGGAYGTQSWADPKSGAIYILMIQRARMANGDGSVIRQAFQEAAAAALDVK